MPNDGDDQDSNLVEYVVILVAIVFVAAMALFFLGTKISTILSQIGANF